MKNLNWKAVLPYVVAIVSFICISMLYCSPLLEGKVLVQGDVNNWKGAAHEAQSFYEEHGYSPWWTNSMFGGMPTYQITGRLPSGEFRGTLEEIFRAGFSGDFAIIGVIFAYFFGFFLMLRCFKVNVWLSIIGGLAIGFSSYFFLIIPAGHMTKAAALGYFAPFIGGFYVIFRKNYQLGIPLVLLYGILGLTLHPQMTYYMFMLIGVLAISELYIHYKEKRWKDLGISVGIFATCLLLIFGTKASWFDMNQTYLKETMRGGHSELSRENVDKSKPAGLDLDYATAWSYGVGETMTLLIPNWEGGASGYNVGKKSDLCEKMKKQGVPKRSAEQFCQQVPTYRGEKSFTSGPVYVGAVVCFLFVLGLLIVPGPYKWALLVATLFSVALSWGRNMMWLTELFFDYFPMYNKFRAVESILVVAEVTMPLLGLLALQRIVERKDEWNTLRKNLFIAGGITGGLCLFFALFGGVVDVSSSYDSQWESQVPAWLKDAIMEERTAMIESDAWRSLLFIFIGFSLIYWYTKGEKMKKHDYLLYGALFVLVLADMVPVNKRFFGDEHFVKNKDVKSFFAMQPYEEQILQDESLNYRVLNLSTNTFNDARTSYRLKSIGGYSAAKLRRYQDLIDMHISKEMNPLLQTIIRTQGFSSPDANAGNDYPVLNMLNMKYAIVPTQGSSPMPVLNPYAMGNCWFVDSVIMVDTPDEECNMLNKIDLRKIAVADKKFAKSLNVTQPEVAPLMSFDKDSISLLSYQPNCLEYITMNEKNRVAVFSEIYYPYDWHLYLMDQNGENEVEIPLARVNYTLRAAVIPAGHHKLRMEFKPHSVQTDKWSYAFIILSLIISLGAIIFHLYKNIGINPEKH